MRTYMKIAKSLTAAVLGIVVLGGFFLTMAADQKTGAKADAKTEVKTIPYTLTTCIVSGDKLGGMGDPYVFVYQGREIKLCCQGCLKDFNAEAAKYLKKIAEAEAKEKDKKS
jgi:hypothetical protein